MPAPIVDGLNPRQRKFCQEYIKHFNGTKAYIDAGYSPGGAHTGASKLLNNTKVKRKIKELTARVERKALGLKERVIEELKAVAFAQLTDVVEWDEGAEGINLKASDRLSEIAKKGLAEISIKSERVGGRDKIQTVSHKVRMHDKIKALEKLGKHLGMFNERVELTGNMTIEQLIEKAKGNSTEE